MKMSSLNITQRTTLKQWKTISLLMGVIAQLFLAGDWYGFAAVIPFVTETLHLSPLQIGIVQGSFSITYALGMVFWAAWGSRISTRALYCCGLLGVGVFMLLQSQVTSYEAMVAARLMVGFFDAAVWIAAAKLVVTWFPPAQRGRALSALLAAFSLAITVDFAIGIPLAEAVGWRGFFIVLAIGTLVVAFLGWVLVKSERRCVGLPDFAWDDEPPANQAVAKVSLIFKSRWFYIASLAIFGDMFAISATATWVVPAFIETQGMATASAATIGTLMGVSQIIMLLLGGYCSDLFRRRVLILKIGSLLSLLSALSFLMTLKLGLPYGGLITVAVMSGVAVFSGGAIFALLSEKYGDQLSGNAIGYAEMVGISSTLIAPALMGAIIEASGSFVAAFSAFTGVQTVIFLILLCMRKEFQEEKSGVVGLTRG
ncbi:MFS transporter [Pseudomonas sp. MPFS]|uniref:MFS transporter n=1 Tax=Pseudomonas sp. MPFS TaxID=2795724 RepID=UPI001F12CC0F|nr:MFS transporter [Pseudomonas sp. MPFS]